MNFFQKMLGQKQKTITIEKQKNSMGGGQFASDDSATLQKPDFNISVDDGYLQAYADSSWVFACVSRKAQDAASLPLQLFQKKGKENILIEKHDALDVLASVNGQMTQYDFMEYLFSSLELTGNFYSGLFDFDKKTRSMMPYISSLIEPVPSKDGKIIISYYKYKVDNTIKNISTDDMLHIKYFNPLKTGYVLGLSPLTAARVAYETDDRALKWNLNNLKKGITANGALKTDNPYFNDKAHRDEAMASWKQTNSGEHGERVGLLFGGLDWKEFGLSPKDMEFLNQRKMTREELLAVYKVPPAVLGLFEYANYANSEMQEKFYWRNGVIPMLRKAEGGLTESFLHRKFKNTDDMFLKFDTSSIAVLQENEDAKSITAARYFQMGIPYNKIAIALKLPIKEIVGGNIGYLPFSMSAIGSETTPTTEAPVKTAKLLKQKLNDTQKEIKWKGFIKITDKFEPRVKTIMQKFFSSQELDVLVNLEKQKRMKKKINIDDLLFDIGEEAKKLSLKTKPITQQIIQKQAQQEIENFNFSISFDLSNPRVVEWIEKHGLDAATNINQTTKDALRATLAEGVDAGESIVDLSKRVADVYGVAKDARSNLIARTETIAASNEGALESYRQTGLKIKKGWLAAFDERTRDTHIEAGQEYDDAGAIGTDEEFFVGIGKGQAPGQIGLAEEDCNCRCSIYPVIEE